MLEVVSNKQFNMLCGSLGYGLMFVRRELMTALCFEVGALQAIRGLTAHPFHAS